MAADAQEPKAEYDPVSARTMRARPSVYCPDGKERRESRPTPGTGTGLAIACDKGGPYRVNQHTLTRNDSQKFRSDRPASLIAYWMLHMMIHIAGLGASAAAFTTEREKIRKPLWLASFEHSPTARVSEAANPGGATVGLDLDSGASMHAVGEARILRGIQLYSPPRWITLPDGSELRIIGTGTIETNGFSIPKVSLVEGLRKNLISVSQLDRDHGMCCCFHGGQCQVMPPGGDVVGGAILEENGLYKLRFLEVPQPEE